MSVLLNAYSSFQNSVNPQNIQRYASIQLRSKNFMQTYLRAYSSVQYAQSSFADCVETASLQPTKIGCAYCITYVFYLLA